MKLIQGMCALALGIGCVCGPTTAQTAAPPQRQIDIGAAEAPLSDGERTDLDAAVKKHDYAAEKSVIDKALAEHPNSFELLVMAGRLAYLEKNPKDAADALAQADKIKPIAEPDRLTLAIAYEFSGAPEQSRAELLKLVSLAPKNARYEYLLGRMDRHNQHVEQASEDFRKAIALDPEFLKAYEELGQTQEDLGHPEEARKTYETGAAINRKQANHWERSPLDLGVLLLKTNDLDGAQKLFQEALQYNPAFAWGHYYMGQVFEKRERHNDAIAEYKEAVVDSPTLKQAWLALGREFTRQGDKVEADKSIAIFKKLQKQDKAAKGKE